MQKKHVYMYLWAGYLGLWLSHLGADYTTWQFYVIVIPIAILVAMANDS